MKYIQKKRNEPPTLKAFRETTPNAAYSGFTDTNQLLKKALLEDQGNICAYCMKRISLDLNEDYKPKTEVEHYQSQKEKPRLTLTYKNMLAVCNGITIKQNEHCDKSKKEKLLKKLNPLKKEIESLLTYELDGIIKSRSADKIIEQDLILLNLNDTFLKDSRKQVMDLAIEMMKVKYPLRQWTKYLLDKEIKAWENKENGNYRPYCMAAIWFLERLKESNRYPEK